MVQMSPGTSPTKHENAIQKAMDPAVDPSIV